MQFNNTEIVTTYFEKLASDGPETATIQAFSEDFKLIAGSAEVNRKRFIEMITVLYAAVPDLTHDLSDIQLRGDIVQLTDRPSGTFTGTWDGTTLGLPIIPANSSAFLMAPSKWEITVRNGKITRWHDVTIPSGKSGISGLFKALGLQAPVAKTWNA